MYLLAVCYFMKLEYRRYCGRIVLCDTRVKAVAVVSMYDMSAAVRGNISREEIQAVKVRCSMQRWTDAENG